MNNYKIFFNTKIFSLFGKNNEEKIIKQKLDLVVSNLIKDEDQEKLMDYINKGYVFPPDRIWKNVHAIIQCSDKFNSPILKQHIAENYTKYFCDIFTKDIDKFMKKYVNHKSGKGEHLVYFAVDIRYFSKIVDYIGINTVFNNKDFAINFMNESKIILRNVARGYIEATDYDFLKKYNLHVNEKYKSYIDNLHLQEINQFNQVLQSFDNIKKKIHKDTEETISKFSEKDLPIDSKIIISEIRSILKEIESTSINIQQDLSLKNLYDKRLPQILNEYITISPTYKQKLMSHNENIDNILLDSLIDIKNKITEISDEIQSEKVNKFKVTHKYLKSI